MQAVRDDRRAGGAVLRNCTSWSEDEIRLVLYAEWGMTYLFVIVSALVILVAVVRWNRPVRPVTAVFLALLTGAWIWANLRNFGWQEEWGGVIPEGLDPVTRAMFYRGWPLAPFMLCLVHGLKFHPGPGASLALVFDWLVLFVILSLARFVWERCSRR